MFEPQIPPTNQHSDLKVLDKMQQEEGMEKKFIECCVYNLLKSETRDCRYDKVLIKIAVYERNNNS